MSAPRISPPSLRVVHAVRLLGFADSAAIAGRAGVSPDRTAGVLRDAERRGWVSHLSFADLAGWSLTDAGKAENERQLQAERGEHDPGNAIAAVYREFLPLNARLLRACTEWQLKPSEADPLAANDHTDAVWDARILEELAAIGAELGPLASRLTSVLARFSGYSSRFAAALERARSGEREWVDSISVDSCHRVWFQLHEDLVATLGIDRASEHAG